MPLVSTMQNITNSTLNAQNIAKEQNTTAFPSPSATVENDTVTRNANSQQKDAAEDDAVPFSFVGKISPMYAHGIGPVPTGKIET